VKAKGKEFPCSRQHIFIYYYYFLVTSGIDMLHFALNIIFSQSCVRFTDEFLSGRANINEIWV